MLLKIDAITGWISGEKITYLSKGHFISKQSNNHSFVILSQRFVLQLIADHKCVILTANNNSVYRYFFFLGSLHDLTFITEKDTHVFFL